MRYGLGLGLLVLTLTAGGTASAQEAAPAADAAVRFGALEAVSDISLSPDGANIAFITPSTGQGNDLYVAPTTEGATPRRILRATGAPEILEGCTWVTLSRLLCSLGGREEVNGNILGFRSIIAVDSTGGNVKLLSNRRGANDVGFDFRGGGVVERLGVETNAVLLARATVEENGIAAMGRSREQGMGVDRVDVNDASVRRVEPPRRDAVSYISDGNGNVRIMAVQPFEGETGQISSTRRFLYRRQGSETWETLSTYDVVSDTGFYPVVIDAAGNRAIGYQKIDGRQAVVAMGLDGVGATEVMFSHPTVDIDSLLLAGRTRRVVGASFVTEQREAIVTDGRLRSMANALGRALGGRSVHIVDSTDDETQHLIFASSDTDPGKYYLYNAAARQLRPLLAERPPLDGATLATVQPISYPAADGTMIPGYLTLPPGRNDAQGLPAIVMPHGGPSARDEWGFDWLAQFFASQGFAVLQPNFRGSSGYGDAWYQNNGFQSWRTAIGDVTDGGRWLVAQGADPAKLSIVGWSYGGYAALQSGVLAPDLFKSIVAIAPVTDLAQLRREANRFASGRINRDYIGEGPHLREGSPAQNAAAIRAPVLMFHGDYDQNVDIEQARTMRRALQGAGGRVELIEYEGLAHGLSTSEARTDMLRRIAAFLPK